MIVGDSQDHSFSQKMQRCQDYIDALHGERQKILVFQRELPLCLELVTQAIEACKQQLSETTTATATVTATAADCMHAQSECNSEQTTSDGPVFEEFIPIKRKPCSDNDDNDDDEQESQKSKSDNEKSDWLGSAQLSLWNQSSDPVISPRKVPVTEVKRTGGAVGAFHPFKREKTDGNSPTPMAVLSPSVVPPAAAVPPVAAASSTANVVGKKKDEKDDNGQRKARRCWSPELHRRFLQALQQLGGSHVATPKQIRDLMKVDGLTNDEVKSHLQKYRLHTRRPTPSINTSNNNNNPQQAPQFVVVGGIWVQPQEYGSGDHPSSAAASAAATRNGVYAPIATPAVPRQQRQHLNNQSRSSHSEERGSHSGDSNSPANSSSTHTTAS